MNLNELKLIIAEGEGLTVEFKEKYTPKIDRDIVALANAKGGFIVLDVNDEGKITGEKITNHIKAEILSIARNCDSPITLSKISHIGGVVVIEVPEGDDKPHSCSSGYFRRMDAVTQKMSQKEVRTMFRETADLFFESLPCKGFTFDEISLKKIRAFLEETQTSLKVGKSNLASFLSSLGIYKDGKINNAGSLMFAGDIKKFIPYSETILGAFKGTNKTHIYDHKDVRDDLLTQLNEAMAFVQKHLNVRSEIRGVQRHDIYEIPLDALREAVVNAIVHRDYSKRGTSIYVSVFDDRIEIVNPGGLPAGVTKQNFGKESVRRNLIIADLFHRMGKVERMGGGIGRMRDLMKEVGLKEPIFESDAFFRAIFRRNPEYSLKPAPGLGPEKTTQKTTQKIIEQIGKNPQITRQELAKIINLTEEGVKYHLSKMQKKGSIRRVGPDKGGHWEVLK